MKTKFVQNIIFSFITSLFLFNPGLSQKGYSSLDNGPLTKQQLDKDPRIEFLANSVSYDSIYAILNYLEENGIRNSGGDNEALNRARDYIAAKLESWEYEVKYQNVVKYATDHGDNIYVEKIGTRYPHTKIIIGAHYDSVPQGPGINDNGSGVASILEIARIFSQRDHEYTIVIVWFTGEEHGYYGSSAYVDSLFAIGTDVLLMFNQDQVGGLTNRFGQPYSMTKIICERDERPNGGTENNILSAAYTDTLAMITNSYTSIETVISYAWGTDYIPFEEKGYVITGYYEYLPFDNPYYHQPTDILANMDPYYLEQVTKGAVAYTGFIGRDTDSYLLVHHDPVEEIDLEDLPYTVISKALSDTTITRHEFFYSLDGGDFTSISMDSINMVGDTVLYFVDLVSITEPVGLSYYFDFENANGITYRQPATGTYDMVVTGIGDNADLIPEYFTVSMAYPNPFNPSTRIEYDILAPGHLEVDIFDSRGSLVEKVQILETSIGKHHFRWNASGYGSGTYFIRFRFNGSMTKTVKAILLK